MESFLNGEIAKDVNRTVANTLEAQRDSIKRFLGFKSRSAELYESGMKRFALWVEGKTPAGDQISKVVLDKMNSNPTVALKGFAFDLKLGLFDPSQLILQTQTMFAAASIDPVNGFKAMSSMPLVRMALINKSDNLLDLLAKKASKLHGMEPTEFKQMVKELDRSGFGLVNGELVLLDNFTGPIIGSSIGNATRKARELGRIPFYEAERINRITGYGIAWRRWKTANPTRKIDDIARGEILKIADTFTLNMTKASAAWWQKGILSVPTQFLSYQARMLEFMLPHAVGGSKAIQGPEKIRLLLGQFFLYGTAGVPLLDYVGDKYLEANNEKLTPEQYRAITSGFWDTMLYSLSNGEIDTDFAERAGVGAGFTDFIAKIFSEDTAFLEVIGGPSGAITGKFTESLMTMMDFVSKTKQGEVVLTPLMIGELAKQTSTWSRLSRARYLWQTGKVLNNKGEIIADGLNKWNSLAAALGIPLRQVTQSYVLNQQSFDQKDYIRDQAKTIAGLTTQYLLDPTRKVESQQIIRGLLQHEAPNIQNEILKQAFGRLKKTQLESALIRHQELFGATTANQLFIEEK